MELGEKIKQRRTLLMLTQEELANRCELTKGYISQLENDKVSPSIETLSHILEVLGTNLSDFFYEEKEEIFSRLLKYGTKAEILTPEREKRQFIQKLKSLIEHYSSM